ncbi:MAG TPA: holo-ACP synthase [Firmicutes bacterium]|jgi:holo-[acyl-carrier protein] synthase|nr:holo-ACP synthase [Bacillota bacterium]
MAILGIGIDLVEIDRFRETVTPRFIQRVFAKEEIEYAKTKKDPIPSLAVRFAAKEAVIKAFGWRLFSQSLKDIVILKTSDGPPSVLLHKKAQQKALESGAKEIFVSLTHTDSLAMAEVIVVGGD